jgi:F420-0:gamma-glutamyl ligase
MPRSDTLSWYTRSGAVGVAAGIAGVLPLRCAASGVHENERFPGTIGQPG